MYVTFFLFPQACSAHKSKSQLSDRLRRHSALHCHHCDSYSGHVVHVCECLVQLASLADGVWILAVLRNHSCEDVARLLHLQQPFSPEESCMCIHTYIIHNVHIHVCPCINNSYICIIP